MSADLALPVAVALFAWWFSTGAILWLVRRPRGTYRATLAIGAIVAIAATGLIVATAGGAGARDAYAGFVGALMVWGWHEASFLMGVVTGPRPAACPAGATGWRRFKYATLTLLHHEIALVVTAAALVAMTWGQPNQVAAWTFLVLLAMRLSAKFNIFLGVPHLTSEFFPEHLAHLKSYLRERPMNALYPFSLLGGGLLCFWLFARASNAAPASGEATAFIVLGTLTTLALIEHVFMIIPWPEAVLWRWAAPLQRATPDSAPKHILTAADDRSPAKALRKTNED